MVVVAAAAVDVVVVVLRASLRPRSGGAERCRVKGSLDDSLGGAQLSASLRNRRGVLKRSWEKVLVQPAAAAAALFSCLV